MWIREANEYGAEAIPVAVIANKVNNQGLIIFI
jgi:hypothetical protein